MSSLSPSADPTYAGAFRSSKDFPIFSDKAAVDFAHECVELFAEAAHALSLPRSIGQIYGVLYASPEPLRFSDIIKHLNISKGSVSQGLQLLRSLGAVVLVSTRQSSTRSLRLKLRERIPTVTKRQRMKNGAYDPVLSDSQPFLQSQTEVPRRDYYQPELGLRRLIGGIIRGRIEPLVREGRLRMRKLRELAVVASEPTNREFRLERVERLEIWRRQATLFMPVLKTLLAISRY
jgi:hypothetical protein